MSFASLLANFDQVPSVQQQVARYFSQNKSAQTYLQTAEKEGWKLEIDHLTIRTHNIDKAAEKYIALGWNYDTSIEYQSEGWWAKIYRHVQLPPFFIDQAYDEAIGHIINKWVIRFGDQDLHHIAMRLPEGLQIEDATKLLQAAGVAFPGHITGSPGSQLRQIFPQAEVTEDGFPFSVLELAQRGRDSSGQLYLGFITEQADSLMKDSIL